MGIVYSGDALVMMDENPDLDYTRSCQKQVANKWADAMCIPKSAENKEYAEKLIKLHVRS